MVCTCSIIYSTSTEFVKIMVLEPNWPPQVSQGKWPGFNIYLNIKVLNKIQVSASGPLSPLVYDIYTSHLQSTPYFRFWRRAVECVKSSEMAAHNYHVMALLGFLSHLFHYIFIGM